MSTQSTNTRSPETQSGPRPKRQPEKKIGPFANGVGFCIWVNTIETDEGPRQMRSVTINPRRYFDRESNQWKDAPSFNPADLPALIFSLQKALDYAYAKPQPDSEALSELGGGPPPQDDDIPF